MIRYESLLYRSICLGTREELLGEASALIGKGGAIATVNPIMLTDAVRNAELSDALDASLNIPDGVGIAGALARRGSYTEVYPGVELIEDLLDSRDSCIGYGIIGGRAGVAEDARDYLLMRHSLAFCLFTCDGYSYTEEGLFSLLRRYSPDIVLVCLGSPKQELLIRRLRCISPRTLFIGLGGALDVFSGRVKRAPALMRRLRLEWLWRMLREPRRLSRLPKLLDFLYLTRLEEKI